LILDLSRTWTFSACSISISRCLRKQLAAPQNSAPA
jgi:hypothetical protein